MEVHRQQCSIYFSWNGFYSVVPHHRDPLIFANMCPRSGHRKTPPSHAGDSALFSRLSRVLICLTIPKRKSNPAHAPSPTLEGRLVTSFEELRTHIEYIIRRQSYQHYQHFQHVDIKIVCLQPTATFGFPTVQRPGDSVTCDR